MAREAGARKVYLASAAPPVCHPNVYGIDMPSSSELIAYDRTVEEIAATIGADWLVYQDLADLVAAATHKSNPEITHFDTSCFNGEYITGDISEDYLARLASSRNDVAGQTQALADEGLADLSKNSSAI